MRWLIYFTALASDVIVCIMPGAHIRQFNGEVQGEDNPDWRMDAACASTDPDLFFPIGTTGAAVEQIIAAKDFCGSCAVRVDCLNFALVTKQEDGIWGGTTPEERHRYGKVWLANRRRV